MIRNAQSSDRLAVKALTEAIGFEATETAEVLSSFDACHRLSNPSEATWLVDDEEGVQGVAYVEPERMTHGTCNLLLIAVHPQARNQGRGTRLIRHVEEQMARSGKRVLLIETMGTEAFAPVRRLYTKLGFEEMARIPDFYEEGQDKIIFWKKLAQTSSDLSQDRARQPAHA